MKVVLASNNAGKQREIQAILGDLGFEVLLQKEIGLELEVDETEDSFEGNALLKAKAVMEKTGMTSLADDSGLCVSALAGMPGVYSHRWGNLKTDEERNAYLLSHMVDVPDEERTAQFVSVITCVTPDGNIVSARGTCDGRITHVPRGDNGFGYDPVFYCDSLQKTLAEASAEEKDSVSHRGNALRSFVEAWRRKMTME